MKLCDDRELVEKAKTDNLVLEKLLAENEALIRALVCTVSVNGYGLDDLMQEGRIAFCAAVRTFDASKGVKLTSYACVCIKSRINDLLKASRSAKRSGDTISLDEKTENGELDIASCVPTPEEKIIAQEEREAFAGVLKDKLSPFEYAVLVLFAEGYSYEDISVILSTDCRIDKKKVGNAIQRARKKLKE